MRNIFIIIFLSPIFLLGQNVQDPLAAIKEIKQARIDTILSVLKISNEDIVADIGTGKGYNLIRLTKYFPSIKYYVEDIDSIACNRKNFKNSIKIFNPNIPLDNFIFTYGTPTSTNLPRNKFTKVLMIAVVHEFENKTSMLTDIKSILKTGGYVYIEEPLVIRKVKKDKGCNNPYLTEPEFKKILTDNGLEIEEEKRTNDTGKNQYRKIFKCRKGYS